MLGLVRKIDPNISLISSLNFTGLYRSKFGILFRSSSHLSRPHFETTRLIWTVCECQESAPTIDGRSVCPAQMWYTSLHSFLRTILIELLKNWPGKFVASSKTQPLLTDLLKFGMWVHYVPRWFVIKVVWPFSLQIQQSATFADPQCTHTVVKM